MTPAAVRLVEDGLFPHGVPAGGTGVIRCRGTEVTAHLEAYKRRAYRTDMVPRLDRTRYEIEYHYGEGSCCTLHPVIHDTPRSFVLAYQDVCLGFVGFDVEDADDSADERIARVSQIQGVRYVTAHSGRVTGAEGPAKSVSWQPALLNLVVAAGAALGVNVVVVNSHVRNKYPKIRRNWFGNAHLLYDGTAESCGFTCDVDREIWTKPTAVTDETRTPS